MSSQETDHVSPTEVTPELGKGAVGKPSVAGVYTNQRLNLPKPWEGTRRTCQGLEPDPGNLAVRDFRGASRNVRHGETVNPPCNRKSRTGNPSPTAGRARSLSQPPPPFSSKAPRLIVAAYTGPGWWLALAWPYSPGL